MKPTAVEWLVEDLGAYLPISITSVKLSIEQAKEMEKQQIIDAYKEFLDTTLSNEVYEQYYNEQFKNK